ncbi:MAG TPA: hypothetical protein VG410_12540, partial [Solirubrobacteraceae bacterium]|nr:hypothetical protein [Solirubrobacteraceae bacterium]
RWLLLAPVYTTLILVVFGWGNSRFRIGADVSIVVLAAYLLSRLHQPAGVARQAEPRQADPAGVAG